jgi:3-phenylpropionate/trans-cinnamate dioxygenase ferredoxin subunit
MKPWTLPTRCCRATSTASAPRCPWHCWEFDIATGQSWCEPDDVKARSYSVAVEPGERLAKGPFVAETVVVSVEHDYVVVEV